MGFMFKVKSLFIAKYEAKMDRRAMLSVKSMVLFTGIFKLLKKSMISCENSLFQIIKTMPVHI
jgi:hypothetical protein